MKNVSNRNIYKEKKFPMTVVIPTIGEKNLVDLINRENCTKKIHACLSPQMGGIFSYGR